MPIDSATRTCGHTIFRHLFYNIRCPQQPIAHKMMFIASAILLISGLAWKGWSSYQGYQIRRGRDIKNLNQNQPILLPWKEYPLEGQDAIHFACQKAGVNVQETDWQTVRPKLVELIDNYLKQIEEYIAHEEYLKIKTEEEAIKKAGDCWSKPLLIELMTTYIRLTYALSCLSLEALDKQKDKVNILVKQQDYFYSDFFTCPQAYHMARRAKIYTSVDYVVPEAHKDSFYQKSTYQSLCRTLYNDYCDRVGMHLNMVEVNKSDWRYAPWVQQDIQGTEFILNPGEIPT